MDSSRYCARCHAAFLDSMKKRHGDDQTISVDNRYIVYKCKVPTFFMSQSGNPMVAFWDCEKGSIKEFTQEQYIMKKNAGELP